MIAKSSFYDQMKDRLKIISEFPDILVNDKIVWKFNKLRANSWSKIPWTYLIDYKVQERETYLFLKSNDDSNHCFCISTFNKGKTNYTKMQIRMTVLKIVLVDKGKTTIIYNRHTDL